MPVVSPKVVALVRGFIEAAILAGTQAIVVQATELDWKELAPWQPIFFWGVRFVEGWVDAHIDPTKQRLLGGNADNR